jgi:H+/Cl- antiporter ClcA
MSLPTYLKKDSAPILSLKNPSSKKTPYLLIFFALVFAVVFFTALLFFDKHDNQLPKRRTRYLDYASFSLNIFLLLLFFIYWHCFY